MADRDEGLVAHLQRMGSRLRQGIAEQWAAAPQPRVREHVLANFTWTEAGRSLVAAYTRTLSDGGTL